MALRWGILSTARINRKVIPAIRAADRAELVAVASRSQGQAEAYAAEWEIPRALGSYEALLADPDIDAVYVSLPNALHADWTVRAAENGKHVLCEKPLATTLADCDRIIAAAREADVVVVEAVMYLHHPLLRRAWQLVDSGTLGKVSLLRGTLDFYLDRPDDVRWKPELGGGSLWDVGSYPVSFFRWIAGEPETAFGWQILSESGVDETFAGALHYQDGTLAIFDCGFRGQPRSEAEVVGSEGMIRLEYPYSMRPDTRLTLTRGDVVELILYSEHDPYQCEVEALTAAALDGADLPVPLSSSRANVATLLALYESARSGAPVTVAGA